MSFGKKALDNILEKLKNMSKREFVELCDSIDYSKYNGSLIVVNDERYYDLFHNYFKEYLFVKKSTKRYEILSFSNTYSKNLNVGKKYKVKTNFEGNIKISDDIDELELAA